METVFNQKNIGISAKKLRPAARILKKMPVEKAIEKLRFLRKAAAVILAKALKQAKSAAVHDFKLEAESLAVKTIEISEGPSSKRTDKFHSARFDRGVIKKKTAKIRIVLEGKNGTKS